VPGRLDLARRPRVPQAGISCSVGFLQCYLNAASEACHEVIQGRTNGGQGREQDGVDGAYQGCVLKHARGPEPFGCI